jgi:hypothetical protein
MKGELMTPERIQVLLQTLWDKVNSSDDLENFVQKYGHELDMDFLAGIAGTIEHAEENGNNEIARFFRQIGKPLLNALTPLDTEVKDVPKGSVDRAMDLIQKLFEEVNSDEELGRFAIEHLDKFDDVFFAILKRIAEQQQAKDNEGNARFFAHVGYVLQELRQQMGKDV